MIKITFIKIVFQVKNGDINISKKITNKSSRYIIKKQINSLNILLNLCKIFFITLYIYYKII